MSLRICGWKEKHLGPDGWKIKMINEIYKNKRIFITGHTGFKGSWLCMYLFQMYKDIEIKGYSLEPPTKPSLFNILSLRKHIQSDIGNILDITSLQTSINDFKPDIIFHLAAQPLVRVSYLDPLDTYNTNIMGTLNVLECARKCKSVKAFVNVTTDKCYDNIEANYAYKETDKLGGYDMYSSSKACSEILSSSYRNSFLKNDGYLLATARAGNVIGGGDWALERLIPDCIRSLIKNETIIIRNPDAVRPWQFVLEPLTGYLLLGALLLENKHELASSVNFGPDKDSILNVSCIVKDVIRCFGSGEMAVCREEKFHEANLLMLDNTKAKKVLNWHPKYNARKAVRETISWYKAYYNGEDMQSFTINQINNFQNC